MPSNSLLYSLATTHLKRRKRTATVLTRSNPCRGIFVPTLQPPLSMSTPIGRCRPHEAESIILTRSRRPLQTDRPLLTRQLGYESIYVPIARTARRLETIARAWNGSATKVTEATSVSGGTPSYGTFVVETRSLIDDLSYDCKLLAFLDPEQARLERLPLSLTVVSDADQRYSPPRRSSRPSSTRHQTPKDLYDTFSTRRLTITNSYSSTTFTLSEGEYAKMTRNCRTHQHSRCTFRQDLYRASCWHGAEND